MESLESHCRQQAEKQNNTAVMRGRSSVLVDHLTQHIQLSYFRRSFGSEAQRPGELRPWVGVTHKGV